MEIIKQNPNTLIISGHIHYDTHLKIQNRMICLPPDRVYTLAEIDQLFDNLPLARGV
jgi:ABC-type transporter Mla MlaB component